MSELCDGVYLRMPKPDYFGQVARLGSTDFAVLAGPSPADWFYRSPHNPLREPSGRTPERDFGEALHINILEGEEAYEAQIVVRPATYLDAKTGEIKRWNGNAKVCQLWNEEHESATVITEDADRRVRHMAGLVLNHPQYRAPLRQGLPEVSVLFHLDGQPCRARFDYLLPTFLLDLKTYGGHVRGKDHRDKALRIIAERSYDVQRYLYDRAREAMRDLIRAGHVYGKPTLAEIEWLSRLAEETDWSWVWIFYQRRDDKSGRAPVVLPIERPRFDLTFDTGRQKVERGLAEYRALVAKFGLDVPWAVIEPMWRPEDHEFPPWLAEMPGVSPANDNDNELEEVA